MHQTLTISKQSASTASCGR